MRFVTIMRFASARNLIASAAVLALALAAPVAGAKGSYASVNGLKMFVGRADWIVSMTKAFLDAPMPKAQ